MWALWRNSHFWAGLTSDEISFIMLLGSSSSAQFWSEYAGLEPASWFASNRMDNFEI